MTRKQSNSVPKKYVGVAAKKKYIAKKLVQVRDAVQRLRVELKNKVKLLYSDGTGKCLCGKKIENMHHTDPEQGALEKKLFGSNTSVDAKKYQLAQYQKNPNYLQGLCVKCHLDIHKKLKKAV